MANLISPFGALDFMHQGGSQRTEELQVRWIQSSDATPIYYGDLVQPVAPVSTGLLTGGYGNYITQGCSYAGTGQPWSGIFRGCEFFNPTIQRMQFSRYWPGQGTAGTSSNTGDIKAFLVTDPQQRFLIQASSQSVVGSSNIGQGFFPAVNGVVSGPSSTGGSNTTGNSGMALASTSAVTITSTQPVNPPFKLVDFYSNWGPGPLTGTAPGAGISGGFVNGMDNTTVGQYVIVEPLFWEQKVY